MWRLYLTNFWLLLMTVLCLPFLLLFFRHPGNTRFWLYIYAVLAQRVSGIRMQISGRENMLATPAVYVLNHQSSLDGIPLGMLRIPRLAIMGKRELVYIPFIGWSFYLAGNVLLNRADGRKALGQLDAGIQAIKNRRVSIAIFPEGTRSRNQVGFLPFKRGGFQMAIDAQVPIVPVVIQSFSRVYNKEAKMMRSGSVQVKILPPLKTLGLERKDAQKLAESTQTLMAAEYTAMG